MIDLSLRLAELSASTGAQSMSQRALALLPQPFAEQLSEALAGTLSRLGIDSNSAQTAAPDGSSTTSVTRQNLAALETMAGAITASSSPPGAVTTPLPTVAGATATPSGHPYASDPVDDAYWAKQPAAVQQLREISDPAQRAALGAQLANEGYSIDVPIMVWGWDAGKTTALREQFGYTWVPSALQQPLSEAPGINVPGLTPYDPANPPPGSILV
jgi:hypothetical protein